MAIAAWKLDLSVMFSFISFHAAFIIPKHEDECSESSRHEGSYNVLFWLLLYAPGVVAGLAGLFSLVGRTINTNQDVKIITGVFGGVTLLLAIAVFMLACCASSRFMSGIWIFVVSLVCLAALGAFYSDWILAAIADNLAGAPSRDNAAVYWLYFIAKRLPFFSS